MEQKTYLKSGICLFLMFVVPAKQLLPFGNF